jgi:phosphoglycolate phosphatase-like HAD superfamily hydrolase
LSVTSFVEGAAVITGKDGTLRDTKNSFRLALIFAMLALTAAFAAACSGGGGSDQGGGNGGEETEPITVASDIAYPPF